MVELRPGEGYYRTLENYIIKNSPVIINNQDILSKTNLLLSKIEIYYQNHYVAAFNTRHCIIPRHQPLSAHHPPQSTLLTIHIHYP